MPRLSPTSRNGIAGLVRDLLAERPHWVGRVTSDEGDSGRTALDSFQDGHSNSPVVLTTSEMLTNGVDAPTARNVIIPGCITSMATFEQIVGLGTRLRTDYDKWFFAIIDFTGSATARFADPDFDGDPFSQVTDDLAGGDARVEDTRQDPADLADLEDETADRQPRLRYYVDDAEVQVVAHVVYELGPDGRRLTTSSITEYAATQVRTLYRSPAELRARWMAPAERDVVVQELADRGLTVDDLTRSRATEMPTPRRFLQPGVRHAGRPALRSSEQVRQDRAFLETFRPEARLILEAVLDKYATFGPGELHLPDVLNTPPLSDMGTMIETCRPADLQTCRP